MARVPSRLCGLTESKVMVMGLARLMEFRSKNWPSAWGSTVYLTLSSSWIAQRTDDSFCSFAAFKATITLKFDMNKFLFNLLGILQDSRLIQYKLLDYTNI